MKNTYRVIGYGRITLILLCLFHYSITEGQQLRLSKAEWAIEHKKIIATSPYIFEGAIIHQDHDYVGWDYNIFKITKIFKGSSELKLGTIRLLSYGGGDDGPPRLSNGGKYIIFAEPVTKTFQAITENAITLKWIDHVEFTSPYYDNTRKQYLSANQRDSMKKTELILGISKTPAKWENIYYSSIDSVYSFFQENGLKVEVEVEGSENNK